MIFLSGIILLLTVAAITAFVFLDNAIASYLKNKVSEASEGQYTLHIGDIDILYLEQTVILDSVYLTTNREELEQAREQLTEPLPDLNLDFPLIRLVKLDFPQLLAGEVHFDKIFIEEPLISITYKEEEQRSPTDFFKRLNEMIPQILSEKVILEKGDIYYVKDARIKILDVNDLSFILKDFSTATFSLPSAFYPSEDLLLILEGDMKFRNGPNLFTLGSLASSGSYFMAEDISLSTDSAGYDLSEKKIFDIQAPLIHAKLTQEETPQKTLILERLTLVNPEIFISAKEDRAKTIKDQVKSLPEIISPYLDYVAIGEILLDDADIRYEHREQDFNTQYKGTEVVASFKGIEIDPERADDATDILFPESFLVAVKGEFTMLDDMYSLAAGNIYASSDTGLIINKINFTTREKSSCRNLREEPYVSLNSPSLQIDFTEWKKLANGNGITIPEILLDQPELTMRGLTSGQENGDARNQIVQFVQRFVPYIRIDTLKIPEATANLTVCRDSDNLDFTAEDLEITLTNIRIDSAAASDQDRLFFAEKAIARLDEFSFNSENAHTAAREIYFNSEKGFYTGKISVNAESEKDELKIQVPELVINSEHWGRLINGQSSYFPNISIREPDVYIKTVQDGSSSTDITESAGEVLPDLAIGQIHIVHADLTFIDATSDQPATLEVSDFDLHLYKLKNPAPNEEERVLLANSFELTVRDYASFSKNLYVLKVDELNASTQLGVRAQDIRLTTDTAAYLLATKKRTPTFYHVETPEITISSIDWAALVHGNGTATGVTIVKEPNIRIIDIEEEHPPKESLVLFHDRIKKYVSWLQSDRLILDQGGLFFSRIHNGDTSYYQTNEFKLTMDNILVDSAAAESEDRVLYSENVNLQASRFTRKSSKGLHVLNVDSIFAGTRKEVLEVYDLTYKPQQPLDSILQKEVPVQDFLRLEAPGVKAFNLDWHAFFKKGNDIIASYVTGTDLKMEVIRDRRFPEEPKTNGLPHVWFRELPAQVKIDSVYFPDAYIAYTENAGEGVEPGTFWFSDVDTEIRDFSNIRESGQTISLYTHGKVMGAGDLSFQVHFDIFSDKNAFNYSGEAGSMDLSLLNPALENMAFISIESGHLDSMSFHVDADEEQATGEMLAYFRDLKIELLDKEPGLDDKDIKSFLANSLVVNSENVPGDFNPGEINYSWDKQNNYFNYLWRTFQDGIFNSLGMAKFERFKDKAGKILPFL